jgi:hypothetical protein
VITRDISPSDCIDYDAVLARIFAGHEPPRLSELSEGARPLVIDFCSAFLAEPGPVTSRGGACARLHVKATQEIKYEHAGLLDTLLDGVARKVSIPSLYRLLILRAIASHPVDGPPARARFPTGQYAKKPQAHTSGKQFRRQARPRTQSELAALARANARRAEEARKRREARTP